MTVAEIEAIFCNEYPKIQKTAMKQMGNLAAAEDLAQEVMVGALSALRSGVEMESPADYIWGVFRFTLIHTIKRKTAKNSRESIDEFNPDTITAPGMNPEELLLEAESRRLARSVVVEMPKVERAILEGVAAGKSKDAICEEIGLDRRLYGQRKWRAITRAQNGTAKVAKRKPLRPVEILPVAA